LGKRFFNVGVVKVCHIVSGDLWAGAEVMSLQLLKGLIRYNDLEVSAILFNEGRLADGVRKLGIPLYVFREDKKSFLQIFQAVRRILIEKNFNVVHSHGYKENMLAYLATRTQRDIRLIGTQHGMPEVFGEKKNIKHRLLSKINFLLLARRFKHVVAVSMDINNMLVNHYGFPEEKVTMIHNGIDLPEHCHDRGGRDYFLIGSSGRLFSVKGYSLMVDIARKVLEKTDKIIFELAGDGPDMALIQDQIKQYGLERSFILRGFVKNISAFYRRLDLYLNTSLHEGIPMSVLEAMSYGLPVIAPSVGGLTEIIDKGVEGFLIEGRNPDDYAQRCLALCEEEALRKRIGAAARLKIMNHFSLEHMVQQYHGLYKTA
jgi:glycosyltransferase involved in cell wall biosynthesis